MIMIGQEKRLRESAPLSARAHRGLTALGAVVALAAVGGTVGALESGSSPAPRGCVRLVFPEVLGAAKFQDCGAAGRMLCAHPEASQLPHAELVAACREAGDRVGS
ncbi:MAG TPA: hypothetical protein VHX88_05930 [Solirubrobacteraceae bacterium]|jgi:hypothetical protein|nr:hypothetical protein [Solirubrobacteraceae bacterium]